MLSSQPPQLPIDHFKHSSFDVEPYFLSPEYTQGTPFVLTSSPTRSGPFLLSSGVNNFLHVDQYGSMESTNFWDVGLVTRSGRVVHLLNLPSHFTIHSISNVLFFLSLYL